VGECNGTTVTTGTKEPQVRPPTPATREHPGGGPEFESPYSDDKHRRLTRTCPVGLAAVTGPGPTLYCGGSVARSMAAQERVRVLHGPFDYR
jgi:hypothetical protein